MNNENESPFSMNQKNIKADILHFKDDVLKDMKNMQKIIAEKFEMTNNLLKEKLESYDKKINLYNEKIVQISNQVITDKDLKEKIDKLFQKELNIKDHILTNEIKLTNLEKEFQERVTKIEYVLSDSVIYPNVVGPKGKYKTFHELIDYILFQLNQNIVYREKNALDVSSYKNKLENISQSLKMQLDNILKNTNQFTTKSVNECEERIKGMLSLFDDRLKDVRAENLNYIKNLEQFYKDLKEEFKRMVNMKNNIYSRFSAEVSGMKKDNIQVVKIFGNYKKEFNLMKDRLTKLSEFIKDVRFRINVGQEIKRMEFFNMANRIDFTKKQNLDDNVTSGIKKYIKGEINADQLATSKKRLTKANIGNFGNISNLNNKLNFDEELNNEDSMNNINNYLMKNKNFFDFDNNNNYSPPQQKPRNSVLPNFGDSLRRKSVNNILNNFSLNSLNNNNQSLINQNNQNLSNKALNNLINNDFQNSNLNPNINSNNNSNNNIKRMAQSSENIGRKRYQSVFSNNNNMNLPNLIQSNLNNKNSMTLDSEESKNSNEGINHKINNNQNYEKNIIKEEEESNSKLSESDSILYEEQKANNNNNKNKLNSENEIINNKNISSQITSKQNIININELNNNKKLLSHNSNINIHTLKDLSKPIEIIAQKKEKEKEKDNITNEKKTNDKIQNNNIIIDCNKNNNNNTNNHNVPYIIEKEITNNNKKEEKTNNNNNNNNNNNKKKNEINAQKNNNINDNFKNSQINDYSQTKKINLNKKEKLIFSQTAYNFQSKKEKNSFLEANNIEKSNNTIDSGDYKSFKGKKYNTLNKLFINKIKENSIPYESQINYNNKNKKNTNIKNKIFNSNNGIIFRQEENLPKHYRNISMDEKSVDARNIQKMVNNLQSYITNFTNGLEDSINLNNMYKNKQNFVYKDNSFYGGNNNNNNNFSSNNHKSRDNIFQIKIKK